MMGDWGNIHASLRPVTNPNYANIWIQWATGSCINCPSKLPEWIMDPCGHALFCNICYWKKPFIEECPVCLAKVEVEVEFPGGVGRPTLTDYEMNFPPIINGVIHGPYPPELLPAVRDYEDSLCTICLEVMAKWVSVPCFDMVGCDDCRNEVGLFCPSCSAPAMLLVRVRQT